MIKWIHHLLEPHCPQCREERQDNSVCTSCETLKMQLGIANYEKKQLLDSLLQPKQSQERRETPVPEQLKPRTIPWAVRRQMLEEEDRVKARIMNAKTEEEAKLAKSQPRAASGGLQANVEQSIEELEKELGVQEGVK